MLNGINIANLLPIYSATRAYLKILFCEILHSVILANILVFSPFKKTELEIEIIHETVNIAKVLLNNDSIIVTLKNVFFKILHFITFAEILIFSY